MHTYSLEQRIALLEERWEYGGHGLNYVFSDIGTNWEANNFVADFVRA